MNPLFRTMAVLIQQPLLAAVRGGLFLVLFAGSRKRLVLADS
jgi:hypothetical protein